MERSLALHNQASQMDAALIDFACSESADHGADFMHPADEVTLESVLERGEWSAITARLLVRNRGKAALHWTLLYFSAAYGIDELGKGTLEPGEDYQTVYEPPYGFHMEAGQVAESVDRFKLIVSTQPVDGFLLMQPDLPLGETLATSRAIDRAPPGQAVRKARQDDWLTKNLPRARAAAAGRTRPARLDVRQRHGEGEGPQEGQGQAEHEPSPQRHPRGRRERQFPRRVRAGRPVTAGVQQHARRKTRMSWSSTTSKAAQRLPPSRSRSNSTCRSATTKASCPSCSTAST